eukprot:Em0001g1722a
MGHFHIKEGVAGPQAGVVGTSPPPPSITIQANMELDMKTTTEQQGVATTPPAPLAEAKDAREALTATTGQVSSPKQSFALPRQLGELGRPLKARAKSLKPKNKLAPEPPSVPEGAGGRTRVGVSLDDSSIRSDGNREEIKVRSVWYVKGLRLLHEDFRAWINSNRDNDKPVIPDEVLKQILSNIGSLVNLNSGLLNDLELYTEYISKFDKALKALEEAKKKYSQFAELLRDFETEPKCANLPLASYMLEVVQRIPRYKLLLADYVKHLPLDSPDRKPSETALEIISQVALHVNDTMKRMVSYSSPA